MTAWQDALASALGAADRGFPVFPLSWNKRPAIPSPHDRGHRCPGFTFCGAPGHAVGDATSKLPDVRWLFDQAPHAAGYGIACGGELRLIGLDLDRKNGVDGVAELNRLCAEGGFTIPRGTWTTCTPSGGFHLGFSAPPGVAVPNSVGRIAPGIDVRGTRGYLVGPGSHGRNGRYFLHPDVGEPTVQPVPEQLLRLVLPPPPPPRRIPSPKRTGSADGLVRFVLDAGEGELNNRLYWAACRAHEHGADAEAVTRALIDAAVLKGHPERTAARTVESARSAPARSRA